jgi:protocatechuate 3,4-dioxygenase beta subunit
MKTTYLVALALLASASATVTAQGPAPILAGVVTDTAGRAIPYARVTILGTADTALTGSDGRYAFNKLREGRYTVRAQALGYLQREQDSVYIRPDKTANVDLRLRRVTCDIDCNPVIVPAPPKKPRE